MKPNSEVQISNGEVTIRISTAMLAQKSDREIRELVRHLYASYYHQKQRPVIRCRTQSRSYAARNGVERSRTGSSNPPTGASNDPL